MADGLITTLAYQLAISIPEFLPPLQEAMQSDKLVLGRALVVQFQRLLVEPFRQIAGLGSRPVVVLDGLDECDDHEVQQQIIRLFTAAIRNHQLPLRILITSRPEPQLRKVFEGPEAFAICCHSVLSADRTAIRTYLMDEFSRIYSENLACGVNLGSVWPSPDTLDNLVRKSSGIFVYATTVIRYIDRRCYHPDDRLQSVLSLDPDSTAPLDDLYTAILSAVPHAPQNLGILYLIWRRGFPFNPEEIDMILQARQGTSRRVLAGLYSLLSVQKISTPFSARCGVQLLHASFGDFLGDERRSQQWCVARSQVESDCLHSMTLLLTAPQHIHRKDAFYEDVIHLMSELLRQATPTDALICGMRNQTFQDSLFLNPEYFNWDLSKSHYPSDLIKLWEDCKFFSTLAAKQVFSTNQRSPTFNFDAIYAQILPQHPALLFVLRTLTIKMCSPGIGRTLKYLGWNYTVFRPFLVINEDLKSCLPNGASPVDFLADPTRARDLYAHPCEIAEELVLLWIRRAKVVSANDFWLDHPWLTLFTKCRTRTTILRELESLNQSEVCHRLVHDPDTHKGFHHYVLDPHYLRPVVVWLWRFPDPPMHVIEFWERQISDMQRCISNLQ